MAKGTYVDGFVLVVPKNKTAVYRKMAREAEKVWKKYGALDYKECIAEDMKPATHGMPALTFPKMAKARKGEVVWFSFIVYKNRKHRDAVIKKVMAQMEKDYKGKKMPAMPFDMKRMAYGGFKVIVSA